MAEIELSIIIPTHECSRQLRACIESLLEQEGLPERLELIVVVDGADPETEGTLGSLELPFPLRVVVQDPVRQAAARNRGAEEARGRYILFLDDDVSRGVRDTIDGDCASCSATSTWFRSCTSRPSSASGVATAFPAESASRTFTHMPPPERTGAATTAAASFASALVELLENRDRRVSIARAARVWAEANLDLDRCVREYEHLYEEVVR
jgi:hypothetical protein